MCTNVLNEPCFQFWSKLNSFSQYWPPSKLIKQNEMYKRTCLYSHSWSGKMKLIKKVSYYQTYYLKDKEKKILTKHILVYPASPGKLGYHSSQKKSSSLHSLLHHTNAPTYRYKTTDKVRKVWSQSDFFRCIPYQTRSNCVK